MVDKDTQLDANENIQEIIHNLFRPPKVRKISVPVIPRAYCFSIDVGGQSLGEHRRFPSRCSSRKEISTGNFRRNNSEFQLRPAITKPVSFLNIAFNINYANHSKRIIQNKKQEIKFKNVRYIVRY